MTEQGFLVTINAPLLLEENIVDCLLAIEGANDFSSLIVNAHTSNHEHLSLAEQVTGRQKQIRFQLYVSEKQLPTLVEQLKQQFSGSGIHYWVLPVLEGGYV
jgi:hypothetical protein